MNITTDKLRAAAVEILKACGETDAGAATVADSMIMADSRGITTPAPIFSRPFTRG